MPLATLESSPVMFSVERIWLRIGQDSKLTPRLVSLTGRSVNKTNTILLLSNFKNHVTLPDELIARIGALLPVAV